MTRLRASTSSSRKQKSSNSSRARSRPLHPGRSHLRAHSGFTHNLTIWRIGQCTMSLGKILGLASVRARNNSRQRGKKSERVTVPDLITKRFAKEGVGSPLGEIGQFAANRGGQLLAAGPTRVSTLRRCGGPETQRTSYQRQLNDRDH